jgi:hypothetical protein
MYEHNANIYGNGLGDMDRMFKAKIYFPYNNYGFVLERCNRFKSSRMKKSSTNYSLNVVAKKKISKVIEILKKKNPGQI